MRLIDSNRSGDITISEFSEDKIYDFVCEDTSILENAKNVSVLFLDVETTGLSYDRDRIIQLAIRPVLFDTNEAVITRLAKTKVFYNDPGEEITEEITALTGVTNADVENQEISWAAIANLISKVDFVIAHNARFDRHFVKKHLIEAGLVMPDTIWACSMSQINWRKTCTAGKSLETLSAWHGFYYPAHDAGVDVNAMIYLLCCSGFFNDLLEKASQSQYRIFAVGFPRKNNDVSKNRGYRWDPDVGYWWYGAEDKADADSET